MERAHGARTRGRGRVGGRRWWARSGQGVRGWARGRVAAERQGHGTGWMWFATRGGDRRKLVEIPGTGSRPFRSNRKRRGGESGLGPRPRLGPGLHLEDGSEPSRGDRFEPPGPPRSPACGCGSNGTGRRPTRRSTPNEMGSLKSPRLSLRPSPLRLSPLRQPWLPPPCSARSPDTRAALPLTTTTKLGRPSPPLRRRRRRVRGMRRGRGSLGWGRR